MMVKEEFINNESLLSKVEKDFSPIIRQRGEEYYEEGHVISCYKTKDCFIAEVEGSEIETYSVFIEIGDDGVNYDCDCPYQHNCKHEYAAILAIENDDCFEVELKEKINKTDDTLHTLIKAIPAQELKDYLLSQKNKHTITLTFSNLSPRFLKYETKQSYEYYYNNLFNVIAFKRCTGDMINEYMSYARMYTHSKEYAESYKIIKAIIEAHRGEFGFESEDIELFFADITMLMRIIYRKTNAQLRKEIDTWFAELKKHNYCDNVYLEDMIIETERCNR